MARPADPAYAAVKVKPLLRKQSWTYKTALLLFILILAIITLLIAITTPGWIFFKYMNRRTFYGLWYLLVCDEYVSQSTWEHWWEYTTTMAYAECKYRFFPELGLRESYMLISDSVQSDQFRYLDSTAWLVACEALTAAAMVLLIVGFIMVIVGFAKKKLRAVVVDFVFYLSVGIAAAMTATTGALYMYKMYERCSFSTGSNCWIGYSFGFACASIAFAVIAIFLRFCERRGICCTEEVNPFIQAAQAENNNAMTASDTFGDDTSRCNTGTLPPGYTSLSQKTVCTQL